jgi:hypothetical protein
MPSKDDLFLHMIPPHGIVAVAQLYGPLLCRAMAAGGETDMRACLTDIAIGRRQMWAILKRGKAGPLALFRTEINVEDGERWLCVSALAGHDLKVWARLLSDGMAGVARDWDCKCVRFAGREAWGRVLPEVRRVGSAEGEAVFERGAAQ